MIATREKVARQAKTVTRKRKPEVRPQYQAAPGAFFNNADAQVIGQELESLKRSGLSIEPDVIVQQAAAEDNPLHKYFTWDNRLAADNWRRQEARQMVNHLLIVMPDAQGEPVPAKAFFSISLKAEPEVEAEAEAPEYVSVRTVLASDEMRQVVVRGAFRELQSWATKYRNIGLTEFEPIYREVDKMAATDRLLSE